jgi:hypothetical protein
MSNFYHELCDMGQRAEKIADILLRQRDHNSHRLGVVLRDLSQTIAQALTSLSPEARKRIANMESCP